MVIFHGTGLVSVRLIWWFSGDSDERMVLYEIFSHTDRIHYRANLRSLATCFLILCAALTFIPPFLWTYFAGGFWTKEAFYVEQARVNSSLKYLVVVENSDTTNYQFLATSYASLNSLFDRAILPATSSFQVLDRNGDGVVDRFSTAVEILFPTGTTTLQSINVWLVIQYELRGRQRIVMESLALVQLVPPDAALQISTSPIVNVAGDLVFKQRQPIQSFGLETLYNRSIIDLTTFSDSSSLDLNSVLNKYFARKYYTAYQARRATWRNGIAGTNKLTVNITMNIPRQSIRFIPGFWQEFKWGWIQYLSALLPFVFVFNRIKEFVFRHQLVRTWIERPLYRQKL